MSSFYPPIRDADGGYPATEGEVATEDDGVPDVTRENPLSAKFVREYYFKVNPQYEGRFTVPILWDTKQNKIVNNESSEIIRIFNTDFNDILPDEFAKVDLFPQSLQKEIEDQNEWVYNTVNNGVYKSGFSTSQQAYEAAVKPLFESLDRLEKILDGGKKHLVGDHLTEADVRLYTTVIRFDIVYVGHFKCNLGSRSKLWLLSVLGLRLTIALVRSYPPQLSQSPQLAQEPLLERARLQRHHFGRALQAPLLHEPRSHQPDPRRAVWAGARRRGALSAAPARAAGSPLPKLAD